MFFDSMNDQFQNSYFQLNTVNSTCLSSPTTNFNLSTLTTNNCFKDDVFQQTASMLPNLNQHSIEQSFEILNHQHSSCVYSEKNRNLIQCSSDSSEDENIDPIYQRHIHKLSSRLNKLKKRAKNTEETSAVNFDSVKDNAIVTTEKNKKRGKLVLDYIKDSANRVKTKFKRSNNIQKKVSLILNSDKNYL
jgi:hypothetical protein